MPRLLTFRLNRECREVAVNADKILYVSHYENGATSLHFSKECFVRVQGEMKDVIRRIESDAEADMPALDRPCADDRPMMAMPAEA